jgi:hypothetical protein
MANTNAAGIKYLHDGMSNGVSMCQSATDLSGDHGRAVAQIANIAVLTDSITSVGITAGFDALIARANSLLGVLTQKGSVAAS